MNILFPIETISRELDSRLVLAVQLAGRSRRIFLAQHSIFNDLIRKTPLRGGVYLGKQLMRPTLEETQVKYRSFKERDFSVVFLHEEGGIFTGDENHWREQLDRQVYPSLLSEDDFLCTWGGFQGRHYQHENPECRARIEVTGHPRFDLLKPSYRRYYDDQVNRLRQRYGKYILINTNFTVANNISGLEDSFSPRFGYNPEQPDSRIKLSEIWAHRLRTLSHFVVLAQKLSARFPEYHVVLRPHPSEDIAFYKTCLSGVSNISVTQEGAVGPWLLGARLLVHDGCTTAIEAHFAGTPTINFKPESDDRYDLLIPNEFGSQCTTVEQVMARIEDWRNGRESVPAQQEPSATARGILRNFSDESVEPLLEILSAVSDRDGAITPSERLLRTRERKRRKRLDRKAREELNRGIRHHVSNRQKFPGFQAKTIEAKVERLNEMLGCRAQVKFYGGDLLEIHTAP